MHACRFHAAQHVPVGEYKDSLRRMARMARGAGAQHVLIITPPPVDEAGRLAWRQEVGCMQGEEEGRKGVAAVVARC